jgi:deoxycytidylate deaminase
MAAIFKAKITRCDDATAYVTLHPCNECMKHLLQFGITRVVYDSLDAKRAKEKYILLAIAIAKKCQVKLEQIKYE